MHKKLYTYLEQNNLFYLNQFEFRNKNSTTHSLIEITEKIREVCDNGLFVCGVCLDFKKAFDTINHKILLAKLQYFETGRITR